VFVRLHVVLEALNTDCNVNVNFKFSFASIKNIVF